MKSKIEEKIEKAREATNEMFAAFDELNERLSAKIEPKFTEGEFVRTFDGHIFKVSHKTLNTQKTEWLYCKNPNVTYFGNYIEESKLEKWIPRRCEGYFAEVDNHNWICIAKAIGPNCIYDAISFCKETDQLWYSSNTDVAENFRPATPEEIALLDSKLAEQGKRFDKEKLELVDIPKFKVGDWFIPHKTKENKTHTSWAKEMDEFDGVILQVSKPKYDCTENLYSEVAGWHFHPDWCEKTAAPKHKEPIVGEMAIFWGTDNKKAFCATLNSIINGRYSPDGNIRFDNAILYESPEQYKEFLKS